MPDMQNTDSALSKTEGDDAQVKLLHVTDSYADHVADTTLAEVEKLTCVLTGKPVRDLVRDFVIAKIGSDVPHDEDKSEHKSSRHKSSKHKKKKKKKSKHSHKEKSPKCRQRSQDKLATSQQHGSCLQISDDIPSSLGNSLLSTTERVKHKECNTNTLGQVSVNDVEATAGSNAATAINENCDNFKKFSNSNGTQVESGKVLKCCKDSSISGSQTNVAIMVGSELTIRNDATLDNSDKERDVDYHIQKHSINLDLDILNSNTKSVSREHAVCVENVVMVGSEVTISNDATFDNSDNERDDCHIQKHSIKVGIPNSTTKSASMEAAVCVENMDNEALRYIENSKKINSCVISGGAEGKKNEDKASNENRGKRKKHSREKKSSRSRSRHKSPKRTRNKSQSKERNHGEKSNYSSNEHSKGKLKDWHQDKKRDKKYENLKEKTQAIERKSKEKKLIGGTNQDIETISKEKYEKSLRCEERKKDSEASQKKEENKVVIDLEKKSTREHLASCQVNKESNGSRHHSGHHSTRERSYDGKKHNASNRESIRVREQIKEQDISLNNKNTEDNNGKKRQIRCNKQQHGNNGSDSDTTDDDSTPPKQKARLEARSLKESSVIQVSDDDADVMSDHMIEKLHKRLTTSLKKSKELQAEKEMGLSSVASGDHLTIALTTSDTVIDVESFGVPESELVQKVFSNVENTDIVCLDSSNVNSSIPDIPMPASPIQTTACSVLQVTVTEEAVKSNNGKSSSKPVALGKKSGLKFGLKITESSAALISLGVKGENTQASSSKLTLKGNEVDNLPSSQLATESEINTANDENDDKLHNERSWIKSCDTMGELQCWYKEGGSGIGLPPSEAANIRDQEVLDQKSTVDDHSERKDEILSTVANDNFSGKDKSDYGCNAVLNEDKQSQLLISADVKSKNMASDTIKVEKSTSSSCVNNQSHSRRSPSRRSGSRKRSQKSPSRRSGSRKRSRSHTRRSGSRTRSRSHTRRSVSPKSKSRKSRSPRQKSDYRASKSDRSNSKDHKSSRRSRSKDSQSQTQESNTLRSKPSRSRKERSGSRKKSKRSRSRSESPSLKKLNQKRSRSRTRRSCSTKSRSRRSRSRSQRLDLHKYKSTFHTHRSRSPKSKLKRSSSQTRRSGSRSSKSRRSSSRTDRCETVNIRNLDTEPWRSRDRRSRSRGRRSGSRRFRSRSRESRSRKSRSSSADKRHKSPTSSRLNIDKQKLREIAINTVYAASMQGGIAPAVELKPAEVVAIKAGGKSVKELTEFCQKIADQESKGGSQAYVSRSEKLSAEDEDEDVNTVFSNTGLKALTSSSIVMNIRNAKQLPVMTPQEKAVKAVVLRTQFPVSSGNDHRTKESEWVPVLKTDSSVPNSSVINNSDKVFIEAPSNPDEVASLVDERQSALRKLKVNPHNKEALGTVFKVQQQIKQWSEVDNLQPGQFMGSTGVQTLTPEELGNGNPRFQAWVKKLTEERS